MPNLAETNRQQIEGIQNFANGFNSSGMSNLRGQNRAGRSKANLVRPVIGQRLVLVRRRYLIGWAAVSPVLTVFTGDP